MALRLQLKRCLSRGVFPVSPSKTASIIFVTAMLAIAWTAPGEGAQLRGRPRVVLAGGYYADPFWFDPWYGFYPYPVGVFPPYGYTRFAESALRLEVTPKDAQVYVDGYYAGIVDDFDGVFQRLHVAPGQHELALYFDGYRTVRQNLYLTPDQTFKVRYTMERLAAGETSEPRPTPVNPPPQVAPGPPSFAPGVNRMPPPRAASAASYGTLVIRV